MPLRKLYLELTSSCNLACAICYRRAWKEEPRDMDAAVLRGAASEAAVLPDLRTVVLGGIGEPTSAALFEEALDSFPGKEIIVTTNGVSLDDRTVAALARGTSLVVISVDEIGRAHV